MKRNTTSTPPRWSDLRRFLLLLAALSVGWMAGPTRLAAQWLTLGNPHWNITLTDAGYSDFLLDNTPGFEGREYLSGEWGAAVAYQVAGQVPVSPQWLEPQFAYPDWLTGTSFHATTPITQIGLNTDNLPIAESVIANGDLEITLRHEMLDTVLGIPMGITPASSGNPAASIPSSRYVMKQTVTLRNISGALVSQLQLFQFLHGLHSQRGVVDNRVYPGPFSEFRHDVTLAGVDPWAVGAGSSSSGLEDFLTFHASIAPGAFEIGAYGMEGNGIDDHWSGKPSDGVHFSVENNWLTPPYSLRKGTDAFNPPQRWVAGAQRWDLVSLAPGQSVSVEILLSVRTGTRVDPGTEVTGGCNGGSGVPGGVDYDFEDVSEPGSCFGEYSQADDDELALRVATGEFEPLTFPTPAEPVQIWDLNFSGQFSGSVNLTVGYDPTLLPPAFDPTLLCLYQFDGTTWQKLPSVVNALSHTIAVTTTRLAPLALGAQSVTPFTVAAEVLPPGAGSVAGGGSYVQGSSVSLVATPAGGFVFSHWSASGTVVSTSPSYTFLVTSDRTLVANFVVVGAAKTIATTSLPANGGSTRGDGPFEPGTQATVTAIPAPGFKFSKWQEDGVTVSTASTYTFTVTDDRSLVAKFKPVFTLNLSAEPPEGGEVEGDPFYEAGELVKLKAKPDDGYSFVHWTQNDLPISTDPNFQFNMTGNRELVGHFAVGERIDVSSIPPHAGTIDGAGVHPVGSEVTLVATPEPGYELVNWTEDGEVVSTSATYVFNAEIPRTLVANFQLNVEGVNLPVAGNDTVHRPANRPLKILLDSLLSNDSSPLDLPLHVAQVDGWSANGAPLLRQGNWIVLESPSGATGNDSFYYTVSDGALNSVALVTVLVDPEPESPTLNITGSQLIPEDGQQVMRIHAAAIPGRSYRLEFTDSLSSPVKWDAVGTVQTAPSNGQLVFQDPTPNDSGFYRVVEAN